jgi:hypothetical protein
LRWGSERNQEALAGRRAMRRRARQRPGVARRNFSSLILQFSRLWTGGRPGGGRSEGRRVRYTRPTWGNARARGAQRPRQAPRGVRGGPDPSLTCGNAEGARKSCSGGVRRQQWRGPQTGTARHGPLRPGVRGSQAVPNGPRANGRRWSTARTAAPRRGGRATVARRASDAIRTLRMCSIESYGRLDREVGAVSVPRRPRLAPSTWEYTCPQGARRLRGHPRAFPGTPAGHQTRTYLPVLHKARRKGAAAALRRAAAPRRAAAQASHARPRPAPRRAAPAPGRAAPGSRGPAPPYSPAASEATMWSTMRAHRSAARRSKVG